MNFRSTALLFGLLLGMLWLFGLTVAHKKTAVDPSFLLPTLQAKTDVVIDSITIQRKVKDKQQPEEFEFTKQNDVWMLKLPGIQKSVKLESFRVDQIVRQIKDARRSDEAGVTDNLTFYQLDQPATTVTLRGKAPDKKEEQEWKFLIGKESADHELLYVNSSDRPGKVYAITRNNIDSVLFKDPNHLRSRRLFEFSDTAAQTIAIKEGALELDLKKGEDATWRFEKPAFGFADFEGPPAPKDLPPGAKAPEGGVKGLLAAIATLRVDSDDDFVPLSDTRLDEYGLEEGKEALRVEVDTFKDKGDKKETAKEILAIGRSAKDKGQVFARMLGDEGVFRLNAKLLEPLKSILQNPGSLRSLDVASVDTKKVDVVTINQGGEQVTLLHPDGKPWEVQVATGKLQKANSDAISSLLDAVQGKRAIVKFYDGADFTKLDAEMKNPTTQVALFLDGLDSGKKDLEKKDTDKDKETAKQDKETKKDEAPQRKKDAKAAVTLSFAGGDKDTVNVQRMLGDGTTSRFTLPRSVLDRVVPGEPAVAFLDTALAALEMADVDRVLIAGAQEKIVIERGWGENANRWYFQEGQEPPGKNPTDAAKAGSMVSSLSGLSAKKWLHKLDAKEDLDKYGLKKPSLEVTLRVRKNQPSGMASLVGMLASPLEWRGLLGEAAILANRFASPGELIVLKIGKETNDDKDKPGVYALRSDKDMLFLLPIEMVRTLRETDLHDRAGVVHAEPFLDASVVGMVAADGNNLLLGGSPLVTHLVQHVDAAHVKEIKLAIRTREELRSLAFQRDPESKDKNWRDLSGLQEFHLDSQKVKEAVERFATLKAKRWVNLAGGPKGEQKLTAKEATLRVELVLDGKTITLTVGALFEGIGYYAQTSAMPDAVFLLDPGQVEPFLQGPAYFARRQEIGMKSEE